MKCLFRFGFSFLACSLIGLAMTFTHADSEAQNPDNRRVMLMGFVQSLHGDAGSAQQAAQSLARMGAGASPAALDLVQALQFDEDAVFAAVSEALVSIGAPSLAPLKMVLGHPNFIVRRRAALILARFGPQARIAAPDLVGLLSDPHGDVREAAELAVIQIGDAAIPALKDDLKAANSGTRQVAIMTLGHFGAKAVPVLLESLKKDDNAYIRSRASEVLGQMQSADPKVQDGLIQALSDLQEVVRGSAADSLGQVKPSAIRAIGPLIEISQIDPDALTRKKAEEALGRIGPPTQESLPGLLAAQRNVIVAVRLRVIDVLGKASMPWPGPLPLLLNAMKDTDSRVRLKAVQICLSAAKPGPDVLPLFRQAIGDPVADIRSAAVVGLGRWKNDGSAAAELGRALSDGSPVIRQQAIRALENLGKAGLPGLMQALSDDSSLLSDQAGNAVVALGEDSVPALQSMQKGPDPAMQKKAESLLKRLALKSHRVKKKLNAS